MDFLGDAELHNQQRLSQEGSPYSLIIMAYGHEEFLKYEFPFEVPVFHYGPPATEKSIFPKYHTSVCTMNTESVVHFIDKWYRP